MSTWKNPDGSTSTGIREDFIDPLKKEPEEKHVTEEKPKKKTSKKK